MLPYLMHIRMHMEILSSYFDSSTQVVMIDFVRRVRRLQGENRNYYTKAAKMVTLNYIKEFWFCWSLIKVTFIRKSSAMHG